MKYYKPERLAKLQDRTNRKRFLATLEEWQRDAERYRKQLENIAADLPAGFRQLLDTAAMHDARVLDMWWDGHDQFTITLHPQTTPSQLVVLTYLLLKPPVVDKDLLPESAQSQPTAWLYDELDRVKGTKRVYPAFVHNILLSDGREICLHFRDVAVKRPVPLVPMIAPAIAKRGAARHSA